MKSVFPIFFILLNLFFILYLRRKLSIWIRLALYLSIGGLFYLWMSNKSALTSLFAHTLSLQPFDVFHETIGFSLLVTVFLNLFDLLAVPSIVRFPNLILKNPQHHHQSVQWYLANTSLFERFFHYFDAFCCCLIFYGIWREAFR
ncbi:hypothetical protein HMPREF2696_08425 [Neisseria sp. HMSC058F07]|uniref:hypothetical protein n=1 Tax=Neisseria sp. HMSC058F07 TaxID=1715175 RepID=UPI0008A10457|nr:hypothetical protein [Neisseria sp. HMSC058F07]OFM33960.1 hypothetical protein HMPREF2696_08425 [Neisseria sp. HMSC058F07]